VPIASAMERLAAGCGASDPVFSPSPFGRGAGRFCLELGLRAILGFAMDRFVLSRQDLYDERSALPFLPGRSQR
jgi:hypothetical protein